MSISLFAPQRWEHKSAYLQTMCLHKDSCVYISFTCVYTKSVWAKVLTVFKRNMNCEYGSCEYTAVHNYLWNSCECTCQKRNYVCSCLSVYTRSVSKCTRDVSTRAVNVHTDPASEYERRDLHRADVCCAGTTDWLLTWWSRSTTTLTCRSQNVWRKVFYTDTKKV